MADEKKLMERNIPGMNRRNRFVEVEYAENVRDRKSTRLNSSHTS